MVTQVNRWLASGCKWSEGVAIYKKIGTDRLLLSLCEAQKTSFALDKLKVALKQYVTEQTPVEQAEEFVQKIEIQEFASGEKRKTALDDKEKLTEALEKKRREIGRLYKEVIQWRREMHKLIGTADKRPISLEEAFSILEQVDRNGDALPCQLLWVTYNDETKKGGEAIRAMVKFRAKQKGFHRFATGKKKVKRDRRDPRHDKHGTVNLQLASTWEVRTVHTWCIFEINGTPVNLGYNG